MTFPLLHAILNFGAWILAKVLANQLREVMSSTISKAQGAFVVRRQILKQALIAMKPLRNIGRGNKKVKC